MVKKVRLTMYRASRFFFLFFFRKLLEQYHLSDRRREVLRGSGLIEFTDRLRWKKIVEATVTANSYLW